MKVLVFLEVGADVRIPPERDPRSGRVREEWLVREIDPASARALDLALALKAARAGAREVTVIHLGPAQARALAAPGARPRLRPGGARLGRRRRPGPAPPGKAVVLAAAAQAAGFDLVLTGAAGVIDASGQLGVLLAAHLGVPCVTQVVGVAPRRRGGRRGRVEVTPRSGPRLPRAGGGARCPPW